MRNRGNASRGAQIAFGSFGIKSLENAQLTARQIEAARVALTRFMKREGQSWIRVFPDKPVTRKPAEVRMGKGKGAQNIGLHRLNRVPSCLKPMVFLWKLPKKQCVWLHKSYL